MHTLSRNPIPPASFRNLLSALALTLITATSVAEDLSLLDSKGSPVSDAVVQWDGAASGHWSGGDAVVDQLGKRFIPFVSVIPLGTRVRFPNSDNTRHHVYSFSDAKTFELKLYRSNDAESVVFDKPGLVTLGCNVHDNMKAYVLVSEAPYAAVSDGNGLVRVPDALLSGQQLLRIWHPRLSATVQLAPTQHNGRWLLQLDTAVDMVDEQASRSTSLEERLKRSKPADK